VTSEVEYLLPQFRGGNIAPSAFVSAAYGWNNSSNIMAGIRIYFGNHDKTLIRRQREDDPPARVDSFECSSAKKQRPPTNIVTPIPVTGTPGYNWVIVSGVGFGNGYSY
jgi:hypothetical protein